MPTTERGEKRVGQLTQATAVDPATKIPGEQGTKAVYFTGKQLTDFVSDGVQNQADEIAQEAANKTKTDLQAFVQQAQSAASAANTAKSQAQTHASNANTYKNNAKSYMEAIQNFGVTAALVGDADEFGVDKTVNADGSVSLIFNLLKGDPGGQPIPVKLASKMTDQTKLYLYMGSETNYKNSWVYGYVDNAWAALMSYGNGITVDSAMSSTSTNPVQNKVVNTAIAEKYSKPSAGIPESDLAEDVQTKLNKEAASATSMTVSLLASGWTTSNDVISQTVTVTGMTETTALVIVDVQMTAASDDILNAWALVSTAKDPVQGANQMTFYANGEAPTVDLTVKVGWL